MKRRRSKAHAAVKSELSDTDRGRRPITEQRPNARKLLPELPAPIEAIGEITQMLYYAVVFFVIAIIAAVLGFGGIAAGAAGIAKILFFVFLVLALIAFLRRA